MPAPKASDLECGTIADPSFSTLPSSSPVEDHSLACTSLDPCTSGTRDSTAHDTSFDSRHDAIAEFAESDALVGTTNALSEMDIDTDVEVGEFQPTSETTVNSSTSNTGSGVDTLALVPYTGLHHTASTSQETGPVVGAALDSLNATGTVSTVARADQLPMEWHWLHMMDPRSPTRAFTGSFRFFDLDKKVRERVFSLLFASPTILDAIPSSHDMKKVRAGGSQLVPFPRLVARNISRQFCREADEAFFSQNWFRMVNASAARYWLDRLTAEQRLAVKYIVFSSPAMNIQDARSRAKMVADVEAKYPNIEAKVQVVEDEKISYTRSPVAFFESQIANRVKKEKDAAEEIQDSEEEDNVFN